MKVDYRQQVKSGKENWWKVLSDFAGYPKWNPIIPSLEGKGDLDVRLKATIQYVGLSKKNVEVKITGWVAEKYFSFIKIEALGSWWGQTEHVFRYENTPEGGFLMICEIYCHGLFLRFRKATVRSQLERSVRKLGERLAEQLERSSFP